MFTNKTKTLSLLSIILFGILFSTILLPAPAFAETPTPQSTNYGLDPTATAATFDTGKTDIKVIIGNIIKAILSFVGVILILLLIIGGLMWMTSAGEEEKVKKAKSLITNAVIGVLIVVLAYTITYFVMTQVTEIGGGGGKVDTIETPTPATPQ